MYFGSLLTEKNIFGVDEFIKSVNPYKTSDIKNVPYISDSRE